MPDRNITTYERKTVLTAIEAAVGTPIFQHFYVRNESKGQDIDATKGGQSSCAFFVSSMLAMFDYIDRSHTVVDTTVTKMLEHGWVQVDAPTPGSVVHWPEQNGHKHIGFYLGGDRYISSSESQNTPQIHPAKMDDGRTPDAYYSHPKLAKDITESL